MRRFFSLLILALLAGCSRTDTAEVGEAGPAGGTVTRWTDSTELFMEYPALIVGHEEKFAVHLTDLTDFAPIDSGRVVFTFTPRGGGPPVVVTQDAPRAPGIYGPAPVFTVAGEYDLTIRIESPQAHDEIRVPDLRVWSSDAEAPRDEAAAAEGIPFLKEQQWKTPGFATAFADSGRVEASVQATGELVPASGRIARVTAPLAGIVELSGITRSPVPGQRVSQGQVLVVLTPVLGDAGSALARARAELKEAEDERARAQRLVEAEAVARRRLHEAEIRLGAAREALAAFGGTNAPGPDGRMSLRSPIAGVVANRLVAPGSRVEGGVELFTIVDPSVLWLLVHVPAADAARVNRTGGAGFSVPGVDRYYRARPVSVGQIIDSVSRSLPVLFAVENRDASLKIGMTADVSVGTGVPAEGVLIPASAVLEEDGRPVAFVQAEGERFERRALVLGGRESDRVLVRSGIRAGERVVTGGVYQVRLASLSTSVPAHGHEH